MRLKMYLTSYSSIEKSDRHQCVLFDDTNYESRILCLLAYAVFHYFDR